MKKMIAEVFLSLMIMPFNTSHIEAKRECPAPVYSRTSSRSARSSGMRRAITPTKESRPKQNHKKQNAEVKDAKKPDHKHSEDNFIPKSVNAKPNEISSVKNPETHVHVNQSGNGLLSTAMAAGAGAYIGQSLAKSEVQKEGDEPKKCDICDTKTEDKKE